MRRLLIWDTAQMIVAEKKKVSDIIPQKATFRPNGKQIAICGEKILKFYDLNSGKVQSLKRAYLLVKIFDNFRSEFFCGLFLSY